MRRLPEEVQIRHQNCQDRLSCWSIVTTLTAPVSLRKLAHPFLKIAGRMWTARCELGLISTIIRLMHHQAKDIRIPPPTCVMLDSKLNWSPNIELEVKKIYIAFYACKSTFVKKWDLRVSGCPQLWFVPY